MCSVGIANLLLPLGLFRTLRYLRVSISSGLRAFAFLGRSFLTRFGPIIGLR